MIEYMQKKRVKNNKTPSTRQPTRARPAGPRRFTYASTQEVDKAMSKVLKDYGKTLRLLGKE